MQTRRLLAPLLLAVTGCTPAVRSAPALTPAPAPLAAALDSVFGDTAFARAHWGVLVRSLDTGATLYRRDSGRMFVPASNMKVVTGAAALEALGPEFRYRTRLSATGPVQDGTLRGDLVVEGSGDPTISARFGGDPRAVFRAWADSLRARGIQRVAGRLVGDDDAFDDVPLGRGWAWDDVDAPYSAEVSALELNEGMASVRVAPGARAGEPARVALDPPTGYVPMANRAVTAAAGTRVTVEVARDPEGTGIVVSGAVPLDTMGVEEGVAVRDNTRYFATVLRETLQAAGIEVQGVAADADALPEAERSAVRTTLFAHASPPLREILPVFLKPSQNQIGEILLKTLGRELRGEGSAQAGRAVTDSLVRMWGLDPRQLAQADGSGLSRYNLVSPELLAGILERMTRSPHREVWNAALPVAGVDGTLAGRLRGTPLQGRVHAKTGTLSGVRALSGYLPGPDGERLVFSILLNHHTLTAREADRVIDAALLRIATGRRP
ncbi:MAG TPA: D-alanyl-D-alanine carboxypeptidase/D-alanyl-D-alanine-endopeptidase [Longimicrobiaceae bacterium]|nr:D-alanyl-D-alanine carboxypeptidase/D-alanyl-D-alanine-endopeptidase [Longimicrobiaceae bacterium]